MPGNFKKEDLRVRKTHKALINSMSGLLEVRSYNQITINDICEQALVSRSTYYSHFYNKHDLLSYWLTVLNQSIALDSCAYEDMEKTINDFANKNKNKIKNLLENANHETSQLMCEFFLSLLNLDFGEGEKKQASPDQIILSTFCHGGILGYLLWQVENKFPPYLPVMNRYIYDFLVNIIKLSERPKLLK